MSKSWLYFRTFPHSNSKREIAARADEDRAEAMEYTDSFVANRHSRDECPNIYWDEYPDCARNKYETKPKSHDHKGKESIRKEEEFYENY